MIASAVLWFLMLSVVLGQLVRVPLLGQSGGLLVSDMAVVAVLCVATGNWVRRYSTRNPHPNLLPIQGEGIRLLTTPFIIWSLFTLIIQYGEYSTHQLIIAGAYWLRTSCYLLLLPALVYLGGDHGTHRALHRSFITAILALTALGWLQLILWPNLADLPPLLLRWAGGGWDPHLGRAVGTWLDPNFFGAFLSLALLYCLGCFFSYQTKSPKLFFLILACAIAGLVIMTQSRSSIVAVAAALLVLSPVILLRHVHHPTPTRLPILLGLVGLAVLGSSLAAVTLGDRLFGLLTPDDTVQVRIDSLQSFSQLASEHPLVGVGYNAFQFAAQRADVVSDSSLHSRAGADNSSLTLLITTGVLGVLLFALPWLAIGIRMLRRWFGHGDVLALIAATSVLTLTIHSQFINSWLYGHLLIVLAVIVVLAETHPYDQPLV